MKTMTGWMLASPWRALSLCYALVLLAGLGVAGFPA
jgi:hypothetical protein